MFGIGEGAECSDRGAGAANSRLSGYAEEIFDGQLAVSGLQFVETSMRVLQAMDSHDAGIPFAQCVRTYMHTKYAHVYGGYRVGDCRRAGR